MVIKELIDGSNKKLFKLAAKSEKNNSVLQKFGYLLELIDRDDYASLVE